MPLLLLSLLLLLALHWSLIRDTSRCIHFYLLIEWETKGIYSTTPSQSGTEREWTPMRWKGH